MDTPIALLLLGQSNAIANAESTGGTFHVTDQIKIYNAQSQSLETLDLEHVAHLITDSSSVTGYNTIGGGKNNIMGGLAWRILQETGRSVVVVCNGHGGEPFNRWIENGTSSENYVDLLADVPTAISLAGISSFDIVHIQEGEADAAGGDSQAQITAERNTLIAQLRAEPWIRSDTYFTVGEPCQSGLEVPALYYLNWSVQEVINDGDPYTCYVPTTGIPYVSETNKGHFSGQGLYDLGYFRVFGSLPAEAKVTPRPRPILTSGIRF
ncbi:hypothetical protein C8N35_102150 [Breoghania corrubedonensis]|uniref:Sialate O-acetylesterase domain-containing protein n=1 Tax=Breoghania corrubedonensis TaxID=665038 RepID=A0A2T5VCG1_9HYPH|nr:hypothetical protein [Breoghania corrubedonensis]PTW61441.1 hypothetical protein C8N35_102150 [Breoghania corrubedonensis]